MAKVEQFDLLNSPLRGTNLIEASAGTGKTYTIAGLFLRLILEMNFSVNEILVVTFTEAATEELKHRIRSKLREAVGVFSGEKTDDTFLGHLIKKHTSPSTALGCLREALRAFDQAAVFTIHGFCRRMLYENAFESGSLFDTELVTDQENLKREIVDDFWRKHFSNASPLFINYAIRRKISPDSLLSLLATRVGRPYLKIVPQVETPDSSLQEKTFQNYFKEVREVWPWAKVEVEEILVTENGLNRARYGKAKIPGWIQAMDDFVASGDSNPELFKGFEKFSSSEIERSVKKDHTPPAHPFFELCEKLMEKQAQLQGVFEQRLLALKGALFQYVQHELTKRKAEKNIQSFDDLLLKMHGALEDKGGEKLAGALRKKYRAVLIDEFQDTDPIQYAIFRKSFGTQNSTLFFIGDPKQAIYGFRGADIFAYMDASKNAQFRFTLGENWRSDPDLITAINTIFANSDRSFVYDEIPFQTATAATKRKAEYLSMGKQSGPPLQLWFLDARELTKSGKTITKGQAYELIPKAVAAEISRLLSLGKSNKALLGKRPLREGDMAVLVRKNVEGRMMQEALSVLHIPSVLYSTGNLFDSHEALEMERVLAAIAEPNNEKLLKAALSTDMIGVKGEVLDGLLDDETGWEKWLVKFRAYHDLWNQRGFIRMFRFLLLEEKVLSRLMSLPDGERRNTNLLHLSEVLHQTWIESRLNMAGLLKWLSEQRDPSTPRLEEHQLRLESDENAVKVVTIHKSKGLEYPIVFCPFTWHGSKIKRTKDPFMFHDEENHMRLTLDLGSEEMDENRVLAEKEQLAENLRLAYVALTRARNRCYLVWGRFNDAETSAPAYLFHQPESLEERNAVSTTEEKFKVLTDEDMLEELTVILDKADGTIKLSEMPTEAGEDYAPSSGVKETLSFRNFSGKIDRQWRVASFSSLVSGKLQRAELADHDATSLPDVPDENDFIEPRIQEEPSGIFSFPRGPKAGTLLHDIFEHLDFGQKDTSPMEELVVSKLREYGFDPTWQETLCDMIRKVLSVPLVPNNKDFILSHIQNHHRLNELEFYFPLKPISPKAIKRVFERYSGPELSTDFPERIERLDFSPVKGFVKGFMDMVFQFQNRFYLVDWKSNLLGTKVEDYDKEALALAMEKEFYVLQYHLYTVALNQYLHLRLPGYGYKKHFGGVYYIFLRGVDPGKGSNFGIFKDRPSEELINQLCTTLINHV